MRVESLIEAEGGGKEIGKARVLRDEDAGVVDAGKENSDGGGIGGELEQGLPAGSAGHGSGVIEIGDSNCGEADGRAEARDGRDDGGLFGAGGKAEAGIFDVAAGDYFGGVRCGEQKGGADAEPAVRGVRVLSGSDGAGPELLKER